MITTQEKQEIVEFLTEVMRGEKGSSHELKAAELLAKYYGLFEKDKSDESKVVVISGNDKL